MDRIITLIIFISILTGQSFVRDLDELAVEFAKEYKTGKTAAITKRVAHQWKERWKLI